MYLRNKGGILRHETGEHQLVDRGLIDLDVIVQQGIGNIFNQVLDFGRPFGRTGNDRSRVDKMFII